MALLSLQNISYRVADAPLLENADLQIERGERVCIVGRNGAGKSTLLRIISDEIAPDDGLVVIDKGVRVARLPQEVPEGFEGTVAQIVAGDSNALPHEIEATISRLGLEPDAQFQTLSGGMKRRAWLGRTLVSSPDVLLLDEPTNHLDIDSIQWLEEFLLRYVRTILFVSHDRAFTRNLATRIVEIDRATLYPWNCNYDEYLERKESALQNEERERALFDKKLAQEEVWIRKGVEARRTKSNSRIRELIVMREERSQRRERLGQVGMQLQSAQRSGTLVAQAKNISFAYEGEKPIVENFSTTIMRGDKVGIIGPNGAGKTTLLRLLLGQLEPQAGEVKLGTNLQIAYFDQLRAQLDPELTVQQNVAGENSTVLFNGEHVHIVGYLNQFLFSSPRIRTKVKVLSGGERNRLLLAKLFTQPANLLVMDEPTNDLDAETLDLLEELLMNFKGTLLMVSHDRAFLNNVVTGTLVFEPNSDGDLQLREYVGGYDDWLRQRPTTAATPEVKVVAKQMKVPKSRKLSFKESRELESLPLHIEKLEIEQADLVEKLADPDLYSDGAKVSATTARMKAVESELETAFERWESLLEMEKLAAAGELF